MKTLSDPTSSKVPNVAWTYKFCQFMLEQSGIVARFSQMLIIALDQIWR